MQPGMPGRLEVTSGWKGNAPGEGNPLPGTTHGLRSGPGIIGRLIAKVRARHQ